MVRDFEEYILLTLKNLQEHEMNEELEIDTTRLSKTSRLLKTKPKVDEKQLE